LSNFLLYESAYTGKLWLNSDGALNRKEQPTVFVWPPALRLLHTRPGQKFVSCTVAFFTCNIVFYPLIALALDVCAELYFSSTYWPDWGNKDLLEALIEFSGRQRNYGSRRHLMSEPSRG
jgi:hypothetical protein